MMGSALQEITIKKNTYPLNVLAEHAHRTTENLLFQESDKKPYLTLIGLLPTYLCLLVVNIRFAVLLVLEIRKTGFRFFHSISEVIGIILCI